MGSADHMTGVFQSIRLKELFFQTVSEKTRLQIDEMHTSPPRGDASLRSPDPEDAYIPSGRDEDSAVVAGDSIPLRKHGDTEAIPMANREPLGHNLDFAA